MISWKTIHVRELAQTPILRTYEPFGRGNRSRPSVRFDVYNRTCAKVKRIRTNGGAKHFLKLVKKHGGCVNVPT